MGVTGLTRNHLIELLQHPPKRQARQQQCHNSYAAATDAALQVSASPRSWPTPCASPTPSGRSTWVKCFPQARFPRLSSQRWRKSGACRRDGGAPCPRHKSGDTKAARPFTGSRAASSAACAGTRGRHRDAWTPTKTPHARRTLRWGRVASVLLLMIWISLPFLRRSSSGCGQADDQGVGKPKSVPPFQPCPNLTASNVGL